MVESSKIIKDSEKLRVRNLGLRNQGYEFGVRKSGLGIQDSEFSVRINSGLEISEIFFRTLALVNGQTEPCYDPNTGEGQGQHNTIYID